MDVNMETISARMAELEASTHAAQHAAQAAQQAAHAAQQQAAAAPLQHPRGPRLTKMVSKPPPFTGDRRNSTYSVAIFLATVATYFTICELNPDQWVFMCGSFYLASSAATYWRNRVLRRLEGDYGTWEEFSQDMTTLFGDINGVKHAREKIAALRQTGSVHAYNDSFRRLAVDITDMAAPEAIFHYTHGLKPSVACEIERQNLITVEDMMAAADRFDHIIYHHQARRQPATAGFRPAAANGPTPMDLGALTLNDDYYDDRDAPRPPAGAISLAAANTTYTKLTPEERDYLRNNNGCFYCRRLGHIANDCKKRIANRSTRPGNGQPRR